VRHWLKHNGDSQKIVERDQQRPTQCHGRGLLGRRQRRLQPMGRVAAILDTIALAPLVDGLRCHPPSRLSLGIDLSMKNADRREEM
jgi:hypothetical protein